MYIRITACRSCPHWLAESNPPTPYVVVTPTDEVFAVKDDIIVAYSGIIRDVTFPHEIFTADCYYDTAPQLVYDDGAVSAYGWQANNGLIIFSVKEPSAIPFEKAPLQVISQYSDARYCSLNLTGS